MSQYFVEYALDPELFTSWDRCITYFEQMGWHQRRLLGAVPKGWIGTVTALVKKKGGFDDETFKRFELRMLHLEESLLKRGRGSKEGETWIQSAVRKNKEKPFYDIVALENQDNYSSVTLHRDVDWKLFSGVVDRDVDSIAQALSLLLLNCGELHLVDPFFKPENSKWRDVLIAFTKITTEGRKPEITYHTTLKNREANLSGVKDHCERKLPQHLPRGLSVLMKIWEEKEDGEDFHDRFVLTEKVGVCIGAGLSSGDTGQTLNLTMMDPKMHERRYREFSRSSPYKIVDEFKIIGAPRTPPRDHNRRQR